MKKLIWISALLILVSCGRDRLDINVSNIDITIQLKRYDQLIFGTDTAKVVSILKNNYINDSLFLNYYTGDILHIGHVNDEVFPHYLQQFLSDTVVTKVADSVLTIFNNFDMVEEQLTSAFKHYHYYFPEKVIPQIYTYISGFNQSLMVANDFAGIGLDRYLGSNFIYYKYLGIPNYKIRNMRPERIVPDLFYAWATTEYPNNDESATLLSEMIYEGKLIYYTEAMCPGLPDSVLMGYSADQIKWCKKNEANMWSFWAGHKLLYSTKRLDLQKYAGDAPFTNTFSPDSPGRTGIWTGWQIVRSYMNKHPEITLEMLMQNNNAQELLSQSDYFPD